MGSMRSMGYSFEAAVADIIDNSISANSTYVKLFFPKTPLETKAVGILDNGDGMSDDILFEAMRYGSSDSEEERDSTDLGRFGLGMKAASLSQCRVLTVLSKQAGRYSGYTWNFNIIQQKKTGSYKNILKKRFQKSHILQNFKSLNMELSLFGKTLTC